VIVFKDIGKSFVFLGYFYIFILIDINKRGYRFIDILFGYFEEM